MDKKELRRLITKKINNLNPSYIKKSDEVIFEKLISSEAFQKSETVLLYHSVDREVDTRKLMAYCKEHGKSFALPRTILKGEMDFRLINRDISSLTPDYYGIPSPNLTDELYIPTKNDIIIVPALCFDENNYRLGHGGGFYDRYLVSSKAVSVGLCRKSLLVKALPTDEYDIKTDYLICD